MTLALRRTKVYAKLAAVTAVVGVILLLVLMNRKNETNVWFFGRYEDVNVLWLILVTAIVSVVTWWGLRKVFGVLRDLRELRRLEHEQADRDERQRRERELADREKRLDEKVRRAITEDT